MKRIYLYMTLLAAVWMTGCSNDDVIIEPDPVGEEALYFSIGVSDGLTTTKADPSVIGTEDKIYNLQALLFDSGTGNYANGKYVDTPTDGTLNFIGDLKVTPGTYDIILIANSGINYTESKPSLTTLNTTVDKIETQSSSKLLMVSKPYKGVVLNYKLSADNTTYERNTYCYMLNGTSTTADYGAKQELTDVYKGDAKPVLLTRQASRIQLESITLKFTENLDGASFRLDSVYLVNLRPSTKLWSDDSNYEATPPADADQYYRGAPATFKAIYNMIYPGSAASVKGDFVKLYSNGESYVKADDGKFEFVGEGEEGDVDMFQKYAFENYKAYVVEEENKTLYDTRLVICGAIKLATGQQFEPTYYHIPITGKVDGTTVQVERNNIYKINVTLTGYGENNPDGSTTIIDPKDPDDPDDDEEIEVPETPNSNAKFDVEITVNPWNVINQYEEESVPTP